MITQISRMYMLESLRNSGVTLGNILPAFSFFICSWISKIAMKGNEEVISFLIKGQFLPISILLLLFSFAFSSATIYLADMKANKTFNWVKRTGVTPFTYYVGMGTGVFTLVNVFLVLLLVCYSFLIDVSLVSFLKMVFISNFVLLALYPLSFILAGLFKNGKVAQSMLIPIMILFMFSITMSSMFLTLAGKDPQNYYIFLLWNPMLYLNDSLQLHLNMVNETWLPEYQYFIILTVFSILLAFIARKVYSFR
ncbi:ABC transporter permease [Lysinibacillus sp. KU-BSD001]|uniref:ABC transporter permease n=1 Tax=Lysinibacillus sp. KU-BSD001 TaxID=3141328 RepID=UPI0036EBAC00